MRARDNAGHQKKTVNDLCAARSAQSWSSDSEEGRRDVLSSDIRSTIVDHSEGVETAMARRRPEMWPRNQGLRHLVFGSLYSWYDGRQADKICIMISGGRR